MLIKVIEIHLVDIQRSTAYVFSRKGTEIFLKSKEVLVLEVLHKNSNPLGLKGFLGKDQNVGVWGLS